MTLRLRDVHRHAKDWGLAVVHMDWVLACLKAGRRLDERPYSLDTYDPSRGPVTVAADITSCGADAGRPGSRWVVAIGWWKGGMAPLEDLDGAVRCRVEGFAVI